MSATARTIGLLRHYFLGRSETFIYTQMKSLERYRASVFAVERRLPDRFPWPDVTALKSLRFGGLESLLYRLTTWSPRFFRWARGVRLIHAHLGQTGVYGLHAARRLGLPLVTSFYGHDVTLRGSRDRFRPDYWHYWLLSDALFRRGDRFLVLSRHMQDALVAQGCPVDKIRVVPLGVDLARFDLPRPPAPAAGPLRILMVGREVAKKGFDDGLRACALARDGGADLEVTLLGTGGPLKDRLVALAAELALEVAWPDPTSPVPVAMTRADVVLVPSKTSPSGDQEGTPTVICEAGAARLPVVSTRHAGIPEQIDDGATGLLAAEGDPAGLARHLIALARDRAGARALGEAARVKMAASYSLLAQQRGVESVYDELL
jgi:colanic acid/amylovoran biosynthesis glycosyltransferase